MRSVRTRDVAVPAGQGSVLSGSKVPVRVPPLPDANPWGATVLIDDSDVGGRGHLVMEDPAEMHLASGTPGTATVKAAGFVCTASVSRSGTCGLMTHGRWGSSPSRDSPSRC